MLGSSRVTAKKTDVQIRGVPVALRERLRRRADSQGLMTRRQLDTVTAHLVALAAERVALPSLLPDAHVLSDRLSVGDAFYVALARARRIELWTADARLDRAAAGLADVRLIA